MFHDFFCRTPLPFTITTYVTYLRYDPYFLFSDFQNIGIKCSFDKICVIVTFVTLKSLEECTHLRLLYLRNEAYDI